MQGQIEQSRRATKRKAVSPRSFGFRLVADSRFCAPGEPRRSGEVGGDTHTVEVPPGRWTLAVDPSGGPRLESMDGTTGTSAGHVIEPILDGPRSRLLMIHGEAPDGTRVNGRVSPSVALLRPGDQVRLGDRLVVHVTLLHQSGVKAAEVEHVGSACAVCRAAVKSDDVVYVCHNCSTVMHFRSAPRDDGSEPLECVTLCSSCPICSAEVVLTERVSYTPEM